MRSIRITLPAVIALATFAACGDPTSTDALFDETAVTADVAASAGDAVATMLGTMIDNEASAGGGAEVAGGARVGAANVTSSLDIDRTHACYDAENVVVNNCVPFSSVRMIAIAASISGTRSSTRTNASGGTVTWTGSVNRTANDTTRRIFPSTTETARVHTAVSVGTDVTTFSDGDFSREVSESVRDSVKSLTFNLPRGSNPYPVSGSIVRRSTATVDIHKGDKHATRDVSYRIEVVFPADAQGNVTLNINTKSCQLNLVTHAVTSCQ